MIHLLFLCSGAAGSHLSECDKRHSSEEYSVLTTSPYINYFLKFLVYITFVHEFFKLSTTEKWAGLELYMF